MSAISEVEVYPLNIPFIRTFKISRGYIGAPGKPGEHVYLKIVTKDGEVGWGEARPNPAWMYETIESVYTTLKKYVTSILIGKSPFEINKILIEMDQKLTPVVSSGQPFAKSAVDIALHDLLGKILGVPLHSLLGGKLVDYVEMSALISGTVDTVGDYAKEMKDKGYRFFKLKIMGVPEKDSQLINALLEKVPDAKIWLDANQAYNSYTFGLLLRKIDDIDNIVVIEQPVPTYDFLGLKRLREKSRFPIAADESLFSHHDLLKLVWMNAIDMLVLKIAKSGIKTSHKIYSLAEATGIACMGSGMTESGVGLLASTHVFSTMNIVAPVDTNGPQFLKDLLISGLEMNGAMIKVPDKPGLGIKVKEDKVEEYKVTLKV